MDEDDDIQSALSTLFSSSNDVDDKDFLAND